MLKENNAETQVDLNENFRHCFDFGADLQIVDVLSVASKYVFRHLIQLECNLTG